MSNAIVTFLSKYIDLTEEEIRILNNQSTFKSFKKGDYLLREGQVHNDCLFIMKGCVYSYYLVDGVKKVVDFFLEADPIKTISYIDKKPSKYNVVCLEDTIVSFNNESKTEELQNKLPRIFEMSSSILIDQIKKNKLSHDELLCLSPDERYRRMQEFSPDLINRVPQYLIASYLGIQPETLSRIRKRVV